MLHTIQNQFLRVTVSEHGAELQSILDKSGTEYLWQGDSAYWSNRALNIFPYVARLTQGCYYMDGELHHMDIHGIAPYRPFAATENSGARLVLELTSDGTTRAAYPREFAFRVIYKLRDSVLHISYEVENRDEKTMFFGLGGHPGFNVPLEPGLRFEDYRLRFSQPCKCVRVGFSQDCYLNGNDVPFPLEADCILPLRHDLFDGDAIVLKNMNRQITLESESGRHSITVCFPQMDYLGLWHCPKTDAPYICIEPWCSLPSSKGRIAVFEEQQDLISLAPHKTYRNDWFIQINHH